MKKMSRSWGVTMTSPSAKLSFAVWRRATLASTIGDPREEERVGRGIGSVEELVKANCFRTGVLGSAELVGYTAFYAINESVRQQEGVSSWKVGGFLEPPVKPILGRKWPLTPPHCGNPRSFAAIKNWRPLFLFRGSRAFAVSAMMPVPFATFFASPQRGRAAIIHLPILTQLAISHRLPT